MYSEIETVIASNHLSYVDPAFSGEAWYSKIFLCFTGQFMMILPR